MVFFLHLFYEDPVFLQLCSLLACQACAYDVLCRRSALCAARSWAQYTMRCVRSANLPVSYTCLATPLFKLGIDLVWQTEGDGEAEQESLDPMQSMAS